MVLATVGADGAPSAPGAATVFHIPPRMKPDEVQNGLYRGQTLADAINAATQQWMGWTIGRQTSKQYGIPRGLPYLTGFVIHCEIVEEELAA